MLAGRGKFTLNRAEGPSKCALLALLGACRKRSSPGPALDLPDKHFRGGALDLPFNKTPGLGFLKGSLCFKEPVGVQDTACPCL